MPNAAANERPRVRKSDLETYVWFSAKPRYIHMVKSWISGKEVPYIAPQPQFDRAFSIFLRSLDAERKNALRLVISGPTGTGKTRMAYEVFRRLERTAAQHGLDKVAFFTCKMEYYDNGLVRTVDQLIYRLVERCAIRQDRSRPPTRIDDSIQLLDVVAAMTGWRPGLRTALVLNIDECQRDPEAVKAICDAICTFRPCNDTGEGGCYILPVLSGFPTADYARVEELKEDASDPASNANAIYLPYPTVEGGSVADDQKTWELIRDVVGIVARESGSAHEPKLTADLSKVKQPVLRYLVQDLGGWPLGAVKFGNALAAVMVNDGLADDTELSLDALRESENMMSAALDTIYTGPATYLATVLAPHGHFKLCCLACGPFPVSRRRGENMSKHHYFTKPVHCFKSHSSIPLWCWPRRCISTSPSTA